MSFPSEFGELCTICTCVEQNYCKVKFRANEQDSHQERDINKQDSENSHEKMDIYQQDSKQQMDIYQQDSKQQMDYLPKL